MHRRIGRSGVLHSMTPVPRLGLLRDPEALPNCLDQNVHLMSDFKVKPVSSLEARYQSTRSLSNRWFPTQSRAKPIPYPFPILLAHPENACSQSSRFHRYLLCLHALIRKTSLHQHSRETNPMAPPFLTSRDSASWQTRRCSCKRLRLYRHQDQRWPQEVRTPLTDRRHHRLR